MKNGTWQLGNVVMDIIKLHNNVIRSNCKKPFHRPKKIMNREISDNLQTQQRVAKFNC